MTEWTLTEDKRPEYDTPVLVGDSEWGSVWAAMLVYEDGWMWAQHTGYGPLDDKTAYELDDDYQYKYWRPLPTLPEQSNE